MNNLLIFGIKWVLPAVMYLIGSYLTGGLGFGTGMAIALLYSLGTSFYWVGVILQQNKEIKEAVEQLEKEGRL